MNTETWVLALSAIVLCVLIMGFALRSGSARKPKLDQMRFGETDPRFAKGNDGA